MLGRLTISEVRPRTPNGCPAKAAVGETVPVAADVFRDGHDLVAARVAWRPVGDKAWRLEPLQPTGNDRFEGTLQPDLVGAHEFRIEAWTDRPATWHHHVAAKTAVGDDVSVEIEEGIALFARLARSAAGAEIRAALTSVVELLRSGASPLTVPPASLEMASAVPDPIDRTNSAKFRLWVDRSQARFAAWYEFFPRSEGGFTGASERLASIAAMGFDTVYLPPIHPIGLTARKGPNNTTESGPDDPGSPWAIGSPEGGHTAIDPGLGTENDFRAFLLAARAHGLEVALDYALQCSPDHPWVTEHPEWFRHRPDGSIRYAENPPKKYQDIYPLEFWPAEEADRKALWQACLGVIEHWMAFGIRTFRVDNPHTKPLAFWEWLIAEVQRRDPEVVFLAEAFTRPKVMAALAEVGFSQSYTYFTWRTWAGELREYLEELAHGPTVDFMRPHFWPNTPDILGGQLRNGPPAAFASRAVLAALLTPLYGIYSGYELNENEPASERNEEYLHSEKYELKSRDWDSPDTLAPLLTELNTVRRRHRAFQELRTIRFHGTHGNDALLAFSKTAPDGSDAMLVIVNLDPHGPQAATLDLDLSVLGLEADDTYEVCDELTGETYHWTGAHPWVRLDPAAGQVAHVLRIGATLPPGPVA